jgi:hypothetical protein
VLGLKFIEDEFFILESRSLIIVDLPVSYLPVKMIGIDMELRLRNNSQ